MSDLNVDRLAEILREVSGQATPKAPAAPEPEIVLEREAVSAGANQKMFSTLWGWEPSMGDFPVTVYNSDSIDVPEEDFYFWPKEETEMFVYAIENGLKPRLVGPAGSGKTEMARAYCAKVGRPYYRMNMHGSIDSADFVGQVMLKDGETFFEEGILPRLMADEYLFLLDEVSGAHPSILLVLQRLMERGGELALPEAKKVITPHENFLLVAADNTLGTGDGAESYTSRNVMDVSFLNRFDITIEVGYLSQMEEENVIHEWEPTLDKTLAMKLATVSNLLHAAKEQGKVALPFSMRNLRVVARNTVAWGNPIMALKFNYVKALPKHQRAVVQKIIHEQVGFPEKFGQVV